MFAVWCVPVDQNPMKSELTTSVIGVLLTQKKKKKKRQENAECHVEITYNLLILCMLYGYNGLYENPKPVHFIFVNN